MHCQSLEAVTIHVGGRTRATLMGALWLAVSMPEGFCWERCLVLEQPRRD